jgi:hypothetical protein
MIKDGYHTSGVSSAPDGLSVGCQLEFFVAGRAMVQEKRSIKTCFVAAPHGVPLEALRNSLLRRGIRPLVPEELSVGTDLASEIQRNIVRADLVIGVLPKGRQSTWILFELGQAFALGRRILVVAPPGSEAIPSDMQRMLVLRTEPDNSEAIDFALDQLLSSPDNAPNAAPSKSFESVGLGPEADSLIVRLDQALLSENPRALEAAIADAIKKSGADVVVESPEPGRGADLAVWSDVLESFVGNPFLIEIKLRIKDKKGADETLKRLNSVLGASATRWALLIYGDGPGHVDVRLTVTTEAVLICTHMAEMNTRAGMHLSHPLAPPRATVPLWSVTLVAQTKSR